MLDRENTAILIGIFLISASTLVFEISMIRIFSISLWYHLAYMIISIALFGYGVSGTLLVIFPDILKKDLDRILAQCGGLYTVTLIFSYLLTNQIPLDPFQIAWSKIQIFYLLLYYVILAVPFLFSGLIIAISISRMTHNVNLYYSASFIGSAFGALIAVGLSTILNGQNVVISTMLIGAIATVLFSIK